MSTAMTRDQLESLYWRALRGLGVDRHQYAPGTVASMLDAADAYAATIAEQRAGSIQALEALRAAAAACLDTPQQRIARQLVLDMATSRKQAS